MRAQPISAGVTGAERAHPTTARDLVGSYAVFDSARDGNWEIYRAENGGASISRLTANSSADIEPRITFDGSKIAFASNRDGNYQIYTMDPNGASQTRLTHNTATDVEPVWTPDKSRIYFASNRSGNYGIWTMTPDGVWQAAYAVTANDAFEPAIGLDGRVSWVEMTDAANALGQVRTGYPQGGGSVVSASPCRYMGHPFWSPDGKHLAYECDIDNDFWTEIVVQDEPVDGKSPFIFDLKTDLVDAQLDGNQLRPVSLVPGVVNIADGSAQLLPFATGAERHVDWKWIDTQPPSAAIGSLPKYTHDGDHIPLTWGGSDSGPAGVAYYFVDYSLDGGAWQSYRQWTADTSADFTPPQFGLSKIGFRVRVMDKAGNDSGWPVAAPGAKETLLYSDGVTGRLSDNRDIPMNGVTIPISDNIPATVTTAADGSFLAPFTKISPTRFHTITISKTGYAALPATSNSGLLGLRTYRPYVFASDDVIRNGHFDVSASSWLTHGNVSIGIFNGAGSVYGQSAELSVPSASLSQRVTVPVSMTNPTLSFNYTWFNYDPSNSVNAHFLVDVFDGPIKTTVATLTSTVNPLGFTADPAYSLAWVDMRPWAGKSVTVTFEVTASNGPATGIVTSIQALLDDISLSSWLTPVPNIVTLLGGATGGAVGGAKAMSLTLTDQNFIAPVTLRLNTTLLSDARFIDDKTIPATLPANLPFGRYDIYVTNAGGQENVLPGGFVVGNELFAPVLVR